MVKALLVNGSPHPRGCTYTALTELKNTLEAEGIEVELLHVGNKDIRGCIACRKCAQTGKCVFDDVVNEVAPKLAEADPEEIETGSTVLLPTSITAAPNWKPR